VKERKNLLRFKVRREKELKFFLYFILPPFEIKFYLFLFFCFVVSFATTKANGLIALWAFVSRNHVSLIHTPVSEDARLYK
jgi:hypothetical protein